MAKEYLSSKNISYQDIDIAGDHNSAQEMIRLSGQMGVPVVVIGEEVVLGFDKNRIDSLLGL